MQLLMNFMPGSDDILGMSVYCLGYCLNEFIGCGKSFPIEFDFKWYKHFQCVLFWKGFALVEVSLLKLKFPKSLPLRSVVIEVVL